MGIQYSKIAEMDKKIKLLRITAEELMDLAGDVEAVKKKLLGSGILSGRP